jgi:hypothetical protein
MLRVKVNILCCVFLLLSIVSCYSLKEIQKKGRFVNAGYGYYINDSLKFSISQGGGDSLITNKKIIRESFKQSNLNFDVKYCLAYITVPVSYFYVAAPIENYIFYFDDKNKVQKALSSIKCDNIFDEDMIIDATNKLVIRYVPLKEHKGCVYVVGKLNPLGKDIKFSFKDLIFSHSEGRHQYIKIKNGDGYDKIDTFYFHGRGNDNEHNADTIQ